MKLSIIIPVYNEEKTISELLKKVFSVNLDKNITAEIIVVDDGSRDSTKQILAKTKYKNLLVLSFQTNKGKGAAVRTGIDKASGDILIIQDADLEYNPEDYPRLIKPIIDKKARVVYGSRFVNYPLKLFGKRRTPLPLHWIANKLLTNITNLLFGTQLTDMETCYKVFSKEVLDKIQLESNRFEIEPEITAKVLKNGYKILEIPIKIKPRGYKDGKKISWRDGFIALWTLAKYRYLD